MDEIRKGKRQVQKLHNYDNVFIFPGTIERLVNDGIHSLEQHQYEEAVQTFDEALRLDPEAKHFLFLFAVALYEIKDYKRAKEYSFLAMEHGVGDYLSALELYLTNLIQLEEYKEVEMRTDAIIKDASLPQDRVNKFIYLRDLTRRLSIRYPKEEAFSEAAPFTLSSFKEKDLLSQQQMLASLKGDTLQQATAVLKEIAESPDLAPSIISFALTLLKEVQYNEKVMVQKFGETQAVIPNKLILPDESQRNHALFEAVTQRLEKEPSKLEFVEGAIQKFIITAFPFDWGDYSVEEIVEAYVEYIDSLMLDKSVPNTELVKIIQKVDREPDF